jgi:ribosome-associated protein
MLTVNPQINIPEDLLSEAFIRAGGPGGQHVNKVSSAVQLRFKVSLWEAPSPEVKTRLIRLAGRRYTDEGEIIIEARRFRHQEQNREDARLRLSELIARSLVAPKPRTPTRPGRGAVEKRLDEKKKQQRVKSGRQKIKTFDD